MNQVVVHLHNEAETKAFAAQVAKVMQPGVPLLLLGELGAGKTTFVQGLVAAMQQKEPVRVKSPTYALCHPYATVPQLWHADLYRLSGGLEVDTLGVFEGVGPLDLLVVEWAERAPGLAKEGVSLHLDITENDERVARVTAEGAAAALVVDALQQALGRQ